MDLKRAFRYDEWANRKVLAALQATPNLAERARQVMAHLLMAQKIWLRRLRGEDVAGLKVWQAMTLEECEPLVEAHARAFSELLANRTPAWAAEPIAYRTSTGVEFQTTRIDILTHILLHGMYHRGQLAVAIKQGGGEPPVTDFVVFARES